MLIQCPECQLQVSDRALSCPHCGYPMKDQAILEKKYQRKRRLRLPNGFGQITEIKNRNLRKPFRVMVTVGKTEEGKPIQKLLKPEAYFSTYKEAYEALLKYNSSVTSYDRLITVEQLYEQWSEERYPKISESRIRGNKAAWAYCSSLKPILVQEVRVSDIKNCLENGSKQLKNSSKTPSQATRNQIQFLLNQMFDYAVMYELIDRNPARVYGQAATSDKIEVKNEHKSFTEEEMKYLWDHKDDPFASLVLIQCYSGWRPGELLALKPSDVNINDWTFTGGSKTEAGTNRTVPIHSKIRPLVETRMKAQWETLAGISYSQYSYWFAASMPGHRPHDPRKQFVTMAKEAGVDEYAIKRIVGHSIKDLTEQVYTDRNINWLTKEIEKIT